MPTEHNYGMMTSKVLDLTWHTQYWTNAQFHPHMNGKDGNLTGFRGLEHYDQERDGYIYPKPASERASIGYRDFVAHVNATLKELAVVPSVHTMLMTGGLNEIDATDPKALGLENGKVSIKFDADTGAIRSLVEKTASGSIREWVAPGGSLAEFVYRTYTQKADIDPYVDILTPTHPTNESDLVTWPWSKIGMDHAIEADPAMPLLADCSKRWPVRLAKAWKSSTTMLLQLRLPEKAVTLFGGMSEIVLNVTLPIDGESSTVELVLTWKDKTATRLAESSWLSFVPSVPRPTKGWRLDVMGSAVDPLTVAYNGSRHLHAIHRGVCYDDTIDRLDRLDNNASASTAGAATPFRLAIESLDVPLVAPGDTAHLIDFDNKLPDLAGGFHFNLHNNAGAFTSNPHHNLIFRYISDRLIVHSSGWDQSAPQWYGRDAAFRFRLNLDAPRGCWPRQKSDDEVLNKPKPKTIMTVIIDDLGWADLQPRNPVSPTPHIGQLAYEGIELLQHYAYMFCSPTRRSILSGRFPVHIWGHQAPVCSNYLPLQFTLLPAKMKLAGFETHSIGKGHLGYQTTDHLPIARGFDSHFGYLEGEISYYHGLSEDQLPGNKTGPPPENKDPTNQTGPCFLNQPGEIPDPAHNCTYDLWENHGPASRATVTSMYYSTNVFAERAIEKINARAAGAPLYIHLTWQNVHAPYEPPPDWENLKSEDFLSNYCGYPSDPARPFPENLRCNFGGTLKTVDDGMKNVTLALKEKKRWDGTLMIVTADNGGVGPGNNHPLRGRKMTPWQGGIRANAFLTGGFIPMELRGTSNHANMHVADWYATLCNLVGVSPTDTVALQGKPRPIDGVDVWPLILSSATTSPREYLPATEYALIWKGRWKLLTNAGPSGWYPPALGAIDAYNISAHDSFAGWKYPTKASPKEWPCVGPHHPMIFPNGACAVCTNSTPCLFDILADEGEHINLASKEPAIVAQLVKQLAMYKPYVSPSMSKAELSKYECLTTATGQYTDLMKEWCECQRVSSLFLSAALQYVYNIILR